MTLETAELVLRAREGAREAFAELVARYARAALAAAFAVTGEREEAIATAEEAFCRAKAALATLPEGEPFGPYVVGLAQAVGAERKPLPQTSIDELLRRRQIERRPGLGIVVRGDLIRALGAMLWTVDRQGRAALALALYGDYGYAEAAELLGSDGAAAARAIAAGLGAIAARVSPHLVRSCEEGDGLASLLDGEIGFREQADLEGHLAACPICAETFADLAAVRRTLQGGLRHAFRGRTIERLQARIAARLSGSAAPGPDDATVPGRMAEAGPAARGDLAGTTIAGYRIERKIGSGGMGTVFKAEQVSLARPVALKILAPRLVAEEGHVRRFIREARAAARLNHPNAVRTYDAGREGDLYFYAMELVEGESLRVRLERRGRLPPAEALAIVTDVARALEHAARHGIVHRDVKPDNVLIEAASGRAKLADLGLARAFESGEESGSLTLSGELLGTPNFMSPEQATDTHSVDHRSDIYSLGATLYQMLYGEVPFEAPSVMETVSRVLTEGLELPDDPLVPPGLVAVLRRMTAREPDDRYQSAAEILDDLADLAAGIAPRRALGPAMPRAAPEGPPAPAGRATAAAPPRRRFEGREARARASRRSPRSLAGAVVGVVALAALGIVWATRPPSRPPAERAAAGDSAGRTAAEAPAPGAPAATAREPATAAPVASSRPGAESRRPEGPDEPERAAPASGAPDRRRGGEREQEAANEQEARDAVDPRRAGTPAPQSSAVEGSAGDSPGQGESATAAAAAAADRAAALEAYASRRLDMLRALAACHPERALAALAEAAQDPALAAVRDEIERDREDPPLLADLLARARAGLLASEGKAVRLALRDGRDEIEGILRRNETTFFVSAQGGALRPVIVEDLDEGAIVDLASLGSAAAVPPRAMLVLSVARGADDAERQIEEFVARGGDRRAGAAYREKLALIREAAAREEALAEDEAARPLLARLDALEARIGPAREGRKDLGELERLIRQVLEKHAAAPSVAARRAALHERLAEIEKSLADLDARPEALLPRIFRGKAKLRPDGRVEVTYDFGHGDRSEGRTDFRRTETIGNGELREGLARLAPAIPSPYDKAGPWEPSESGLVGSGFDRFVWRGRIEGPVEVEVLAFPLFERNVAVTLCDGGVRYYAAGASFALPRLPEFLRPRFPDLFSRFDPFLEPADRLLEVESFPEMREIGRGRAAALAPRQPVRMKAVRADGKTAADGRLAEVRLTLACAGGRPLQASDEKALLAKGSIGLATFGSAAVFRSVRILGKLDPEWLSAEQKRLAAAGGGANGR